MAMAGIFYRNLHVLLRRMNQSNIKTQFFCTTSQIEFTEQHISFLSCGSVYEKWRKDKKFPKIPDHALAFNVSYIDTHKNISCDTKSPPTVVTLHGAPGSYKDYSGLILFLHQMGIRVISPNFPDFSNFPPGVFRHSVEEKAAFVDDFLKTISVKQVDFLICHSSSIYSALELCLTKDVTVKSLIMLNTGTYFGNISTRCMNFMKLFVKAGEIPFCLKLMEAIRPIVLKFVESPVRADNCLDPLLSATTTVNANLSQSKEKFQQLVKHKKPILYIFSSNDKLVREKGSQKVANLFGASVEDIYVYNKDGILEKNGKEKSDLKVISFENGSHYVFLKYPDIVHREIAEFINKNM